MIEDEDEEAAEAGVTKRDEAEVEVEAVVERGKLEEADTEESAPAAAGRPSGGREHRHSAGTNSAIFHNRIGRNKKGWTFSVKSKEAIQVSCMHETLAIHSVWARQI